MELKGMQIVGEVTNISRENKRPRKGPRIWMGRGELREGKEDSS